MEFISGIFFSLSFGKFQDREALVKVKDMLLEDKEALEAERLSLAKTVEILGKDVKEREKQVSTCALPRPSICMNYLSVRGIFYSDGVFQILE